MTSETDHDILLEIRGQVRSINERCVLCHKALEGHGEDISALQGDMKAVNVKLGLGGLIVTGIAGAISWIKG